MLLLLQIEVLYFLPNVNDAKKAMLLGYIHKSQVDLK